MKKNPLTLIVGLLLGLMFLSMLFVFQVRNTEMAIRTTFSRPSKEAIAEPGAYFRLPWPIQRIYRFDKRVHNLDDRFEETLTRDSVNLNIQVFAGWRIESPVVFLPKFPEGSVSAARQTLSELVRSSKREIVGQYDFADFVSTNPETLKLEEIENRILEAVRSKAETNYGIKFDFLAIRRLGLPQNVSEKVIDRMRAERQRVIDQLQGEGEEEATKIRSRADAERARLLAEANAEAERIRGRGDAEAAEFYTVFQQDPKFADFLQRLNALSAALENKATLIFDRETPPFDLFQSGALDEVASPSANSASNAREVPSMRYRSPEAPRTNAVANPNPEASQE